MMFTMILAVGEMFAAGALMAPASESPGLVESRPPLEERLGDQPSLLALQPGEQLTNPRTGVTCTMRILRAAPSMDAGAVRPVPQSVDPSIRAKVSPCLD